MLHQASALALYVQKGHIRALLIHYSRVLAQSPPPEVNTREQVQFQLAEHLGKLWAVEQGYGLIQDQDKELPCEQPLKKGVQQG